MCLANLGETIVYLISNYPNDCADIHCGAGLDHVSRGLCGEKGPGGRRSAESPVGVSE